MSRYTNSAVLCTVHTFPPQVAAAIPSSALYELSPGAYTLFLRKLQPQFQALHYTILLQSFPRILFKTVDACLGVVGVFHIPRHARSGENPLLMAGSTAGIHGSNDIQEAVPPGVAPTSDASQNASPRGKWTGGIEGVLMDCPVDAVWELASDWVNWQRWWSGNPRFELREGENRKAGCLRYVANNVPSEPGAWVKERLLAIDNEKHFFSYNVEENEIFGGIRGYIAKAQFRGTDDGKTLVEFFKYEIEPVKNHTPETWTFIMMNTYTSIVKDLERGAQRLAAGLDPKPDHAPTSKVAHHTYPTAVA